MLEQIRATPLLSTLDDDQLRRVVRGASRRTLADGGWLFSQGDVASHFYLVLKGQVRLFRLAPDGGEKIIEIVSAGETFAEALMFLSEPRYPVCASGLGPAEVLCLDAADFADMLRGSLDSCFLIMGSLSRRLRGLIMEIDDLTLHSARGRVARWLLRRCPDGGNSFTLELRKGVLASRLSITPETFSRVVRQLSDEAVLSMDASRVTVLDAEALRRAAELDADDDG